MFRCSADPDVALPDGEPLSRIYCDESINASIVVDDNTLHFATKNELFAIATKIAEKKVDHRGKMPQCVI